MEVSQKELIELGAVDTRLFGSAFFPKTARQASPKFHTDIDELIDGPDRFVNIQVFRGGAKTSRLRIHVAKRIGYRISKTIVFVSKAQTHAARNLMWMRTAIERNVAYRDTFQLKRGAKWNDEEMNILCGPEEESVWLIGIGITGSTRGINVEDYRPDLILVDDVMDEENSATLEQRTKTYKLVHGSLRHSLAPASENRWAKLAILQTPLDFDDISERAFKDPQFVSVRFGCWTKETENLPLERRESAWPERWSSEVLREERAAALAKNELSIFSREMECKLIAPEDAIFREEWIKYFGEEQDEKEPELHTMRTVLVIDPVPPPSEREVKKGLAGKDYEALTVVGKCGGKLYVLETVYNKGHDPSWTVAELFRLASRWRVQTVLVEAIAYQQTLVWLIKAAMKRAGRYWHIKELKDKRSKRDRIVQGLKGPLSEGVFYVRNSQIELISQIISYSNVDHDDVIETAAVGAEELQGAIIDEVAADMDEDDAPALLYHRGAP